MDECMDQISALLASRVVEEEDEIKLIDWEDTIKVTFTENGTSGSYYETAHVKSEQVWQPSILKGGDSWRSIIRVDCSGWFHCITIGWMGFWRIRWAWVSRPCSYRQHIFHMCCIIYVIVIFSTTLILDILTLILVPGKTIQTIAIYWRLWEIESTAILYDSHEGRHGF